MTSYTGKQTKSGKVACQSSKCQRMATVDMRYKMAHRPGVESFHGMHCAACAAKLQVIEISRVENADGFAGRTITAYQGGVWKDQKYARWQEREQEGAYTL